MNKEKPTQEMFRLLLGLVIVAAITIAIISTLRGPTQGSASVAASTSPSSSSQQPATPPQEPTTAVPNPYPMEIPLTPSAAAAEATSSFLSTRKADLHATFLATTPSPTPPVTIPPTGTREDMYVKPSGEKLGLDAINAWAGIWDGKQISVFAGAILDDPNQGAIFVWISDVIANQFLTPTKHGGVRVMSERNNRLTLVSTDGTTYYFDIPALSYVSSLTAFAPSITPAPTRTPFPTKSLNGLLTPVSPYNPYPAPTGQSTVAP
jgi:hypothetical protein